MYFTKRNIFAGEIEIYLKLKIEIYLKLEIEIYLEEKEKYICERKRKRSRELSANFYIDCPLVTQLTLCMEINC